MSFADWSWEPTVIAALIALLVAYVAAWRRGWLTSGDDTTPWFRRSAWRPVTFCLGIAAAWMALLSPIDRGGDHYLLFLHMIQHLLLMMVVPPLLLLGICGHRYEKRPRLLAWLLSPWPAASVFTLALMVWHIPTLYNATLTTLPLHIFEHVTFLVAGVILWWPIVDPWRLTSGHVVSAGEKIAVLVVSGIPPTVLGFILAMAPTPLYTFYALAPRLWGLSAVGDQQIAGTIMLGAGNLIYFAAISVIFLRIFVDPRDEEAVAAELSSVDANRRVPALES